MPPRPSPLSKRAAVATSVRPLPPLLIGGKSTHTDASRGFQTNLDPSPLPQQPSDDGTLMVIWLTASHSTQAAGTRHGRAQDASAITFQSGRADVSLLFGLVPGIVHSQSHPACVRKQSSGSRARSSTAGTCEWRDRDRDGDMAPGNEGIPSRRNAFTIQANGTPTPVSHAQHKMAEVLFKLWRGERPQSFVAPVEVGRALELLLELVKLTKLTKQCHTDSWDPPAAPPGAQPSLGSF